jgi:hypothetical protein
MASPTSLSGRATPPTEDVTESEEVPENVREITERVGIEACETTSAQPLMPETVIPGAFVRIGKYCVGLGRLFELLLGVRIIRVAVGMVFDRQLPISGLDLACRCISPDTENIVIISPIFCRHFFSGLAFDFRIVVAIVTV